ncbi:MAG: DUF58 domain-containing protein [Myxococcota bacterium]
MAFLEPTAVAQLGNLSVKARIIVEGALTGLHRARLRGSSIEFAEHKEYSPGDEIRHIDWKAYAKVDRYYVKQFEQESQLTVHLVLDGSGSMAYRGDGISKLEYGSYLIAALAHLLIRQRDRVGLTVFGDPSIDGYVPPRARPTHLRDMFAVLDQVGQRGGTGTESAHDALERVAELTRRRRSLIILAADLLGSGDRAVEVLRLLRARHHDVVVFHLLDRHELEFPFTGLTMFESLEDEAKILANPDSVRREYLRRLGEFLAATQRRCIDGGVEYQLVATDQPVEQTLLEFLTRRSRTAGAPTRTRRGSTPRAG